MIYSGQFDTKHASLFALSARKARVYFLMAAMFSTAAAQEYKMATYLCRLTYKESFKFEIKKMLGGPF